MLGQNILVGFERTVVTQMSAHDISVERIVSSADEG